MSLHITRHGVQEFLHAFIFQSGSKITGINLTLPDLMSDTLCAQRSLFQELFQQRLIADRRVLTDIHLCPICRKIHTASIQSAL